MIESLSCGRLEAAIVCSANNYLPSVLLEVLHISELLNDDPS